MPVNEHCLALAAPSGHLDTVAFLADSGCPLLGTLLAGTLMPRGTRLQHPQVVEVQSGADNVVGGCAVLQAHRSAHAGREAVHPCHAAGACGRDSLTSRTWMRTLDCPLCWVHRWPMWSTPSVARAAPQGSPHTLHWSLGDCDGATTSTSLLIYAAVACARGCGCVGQACSCCVLQRLLIVLASAPWDAAAPVETSLVRR